MFGNLVSLILSGALFLGLQTVFRWPVFFYILILLGTALIFGLMWIIWRPRKKQKQLANKSFFYFFALLLVFFLSAVFAMMFVKYGILSYLLSGFVSVLLYSFFYTLKKYFPSIRAIIVHGKSEHGPSLNEFLSKMALFCVAVFFLVVSVIYGFVVFFQISLWEVLPFLFVINVFLIKYLVFIKENFACNNDKERISGEFFNRSSIIIALLSSQVFIILTFLPMSLFSAGMILSIFFGLSLLYVARFLGSDESWQLKFYQFLIGGIILAVSLLALQI
jgi:Ca2+/Na+ antiporter